MFTYIKYCFEKYYFVTYLYFILVVKEISFKNNYYPINFLLTF